MPLHTTPTASVHRPSRLVLAATLTAATCAASGTIALGSSGDQPLPSRYHDIEANKANSMRAFGLHLAERRANPPSRYDDLEANKARSQRGR